MKKKAENPYKECEDCQELGDCPHPEIEDNMMGSPMPPDICPKPIAVMNHTLKKRTLRNSKYGLS